MLDFFVSYTYADQPWAEWIAWQLEEQGYTTLLHAWDFKAGSNFVLAMQQAASRASRTVAVVSPEYLASDLTQSEWAAAFAQDPTGGQGKLLPVLVRPCSITGLLAQIQAIDLVGRDEAEARKVLLTQVKQERLKPSKPPKFPETEVYPEFPGSMKQSSFVISPMLTSETLVVPTALEPRLTSDLKLLPFEPETVFIPPGPFLLGSAPHEGVPNYEMPQHQVNLPAYRIGRYPVTNGHYAEFIRQTGRLVAPETGWSGQTPSFNQFNLPVMGVTWYEALAYCDWLSQKTDRPYTLPSEAQWEKAARGTDDRIYPWGNDWENDRCNYGHIEPAPVDAYEPQSVYGCYDMVGNIREWTNTIWGVKRLEADPRFCYPWVDDGREEVTTPSHYYRVYRGGSFNDKLTWLRCSARNGYDPTKPGPPYKRHGFRVALKI